MYVSCQGLASEDLEERLKFVTARKTYKVKKTGPTGTGSLPVLRAFDHVLHSVAKCTYQIRPSSMSMSSTPLIHGWSVSTSGCFPLDHSMGTKKLRPASATAPDHLQQPA